MQPMPFYGYKSIWHRSCTLLTSGSPRGVFPSSFREGSRLCSYPKADQRHKGTCHLIQTSCDSPNMQHRYQSMLLVDKPQGSPVMKNQSLHLKARLSERPVFQTPRLQLHLQNFKCQLLQVWKTHILSFSTQSFIMCFTIARKPNNQNHETSQHSAFKQSTSPKESRLLESSGKSAPTQEGQGHMSIAPLEPKAGFHLLNDSLTTPLRFTGMLLFYIEHF